MKKDYESWGIWRSLLWLVIVAPARVAEDAILSRYGRLCSRYWWWKHARQVALRERLYAEGQVWEQRYDEEQRLRAVRCVELLAIRAERRRRAARCAELRAVRAAGGKQQYE